MSNQNELARIEAYSDGIFAIAATLLVLEIRVPNVLPPAPIGELWHQLANLWPSYLAFVLSFGTILVVWVNHHHAISRLLKTSRAFLYANGFLLLMVTFQPFPTAILARYIEGPYARVAIVFYAGSSLLMNLAFMVWFLAMQRPVYLIKPDLTRADIRTLWMQLAGGAITYSVIAIVGWWLPIVALVMTVLLYMLWVLLSIGIWSPE